LDFDLKIVFKRNRKRIYLFLILSALGLSCKTQGRTIYRAKVFAVLAFYQNLFLLSAIVGLHKTFQLSAIHVFLKSKWLAGLQLFSASPSYRSYQGYFYHKIFNSYSFEYVTFYM
jgi:hypothetical protein